MGYVAKVNRLSKKVAEQRGISTKRLRPDGTPYWQLVYENRRKDRPKDTLREQFIPKKDLKRYGIDETWTLVEVQKHCKHLNSAENLKKRNERAHARKVAQDNHEELVESVFLPKHIVAEFKEKILINRFAQGEGKARYQRLLSHWNFAQKMIAELEIEPKNYADECNKFYVYFQEKEISPAYAIKIVRVVNAWGQFYAKAFGGSGIDTIKNPRGRKREDIATANQKKEGYGGPADSLTPEDLNQKSAINGLLEYNFNWLYLSVWLGLRAEEVDNLKNTKYWNIKKDEKTKVDILWVYQTKLMSVAEAKRWKPIPLFLPQQKKCIELIDSKNFKRPLYKTLKNVFTKKRITCYSGRKNFTDLMLSFQQELPEISVWLGHSSIEMTYKHYKNKQVVRFNQPQTPLKRVA